MLDENRIHSFEFSNKTHKNWNFRLQFLRGSNVALSNLSSLIVTEPIFIGCEVIASMPDDLPFGMQEATTMTLKFDFTNLSTTNADFKDWIMEGGQIITDVYYPNQYRLLSNNGRGASDTTYDTIEFWGIHDRIPSRKFKGAYGKNQSVDIDLFSIDSYLLNNITDFNVTLGTAVNKRITHYAYFQTSPTAFFVNIVGKWQDLRIINFNDLVGFIKTKMTDLQETLLRDWLVTTGTVINNTNTPATHWDFNKQLYNLTTQEGVGLGSDADVYMIASIIESSIKIGGLTSANSKNGFFQFKNANDLLTSLCETFISKLTFQYFEVYLSGTKCLINFKRPLNDIDGGSITLAISDIIGEWNLDYDLNVSETTVSYTNYDKNQNKTIYKTYGNLKQDSYDNKSLFTTNIAVDKPLNANYNLLSYISVNNLFYLDSAGFLNDLLVLLHSNCGVRLSTSITINNESTAGDELTGLLNDNKTNNEVEVIKWINKRYNKSGFNYVQAKAYTNLMNSKSGIFEFTTSNFKIRPKELGQLVIADLSSYLDLPANLFVSTNHILTYCKIDFFTGISENKLFVRGI
jgi:hypothetical protein